MQKDKDMADLISQITNKKCRRCGKETEYADIGGLSILCSDCEKIEAKAESSREVKDFDKNPVSYDISDILRDRAYFEVLAYFADSLTIPDQRLLTCEEVPTFIGRLSRDWRNGFCDMVVEGHHAILYQVLPSLDRCGASRAAKAVAECLVVLDQFGYRALVPDHEEPYCVLTESDRESLDDALRELDSRWNLFADINNEMQVAAHAWVIDHKEDFEFRRRKEA